MRTQIIQATLGTLLMLAAACGGEMAPTEEAETSASVVSSNNSYCYSLQSGGVSTGQKCFTTKAGFCQSLCAETVAGAAAQCTAQCPGTTPAPPAPPTNGGGSTGGGSTNTNSSYCFNLQCNSAGSGQKCFANKSDFCAALKAQTCSAATLYSNLFCN